jgi:ABC-2 type transport system permease protein
MKNALLIAGREISSFVRAPIGWIVAAAALLIEGIVFYAMGLRGTKLSADVLRSFFDGATGVTTVVAVLLSMRLVAGERENNTLVLLNTAPIREVEIVLGKFLAGLAFLAAIAALSVYMPLLIFVNGKVSPGHILVGYAGIVLIASATLSVALFASSLVSTQVVAAILGGAILAAIYFIYMLAPQTDPPIKDFLHGLSLFQVRQSPFMKGVVNLEHVVFNLAVAYFFLLATTKTLEARRWR